MPKLAIIGAGVMGANHGRVARGVREFTVTSICDPDLERAAAVAAPLKAKATSDVDEAIAGADAVILAAPSHLHGDIGEKVLKSGRDLLVEKPIATTARDAERLIEAAAANDRILMVGHVERFNPAVSELTSMIDNPISIEITRVGPFSPRNLADVFLDLMIHDIDLILALVGSEVVGIESLGAAVFGPNEDWAQARLAFADGTVANLRASRVSQQPERTLEVWCPDRHVRIDFAARQAIVMRHSRAVQTGQIEVQHLTADERQSLTQRLFTELLPVTALSVPEVNAIAAEQAEFIMAIRTGSTVHVCGRAGRAALDIAERIITAISSHRWDGTAHGPVGPRREPIRRPLAGHHWSLAPSANPAPGKRRAG